MCAANRANDQVEETVTRRRLIAQEKNAPAPDFWEYLGKLKPEDWVSAVGGPTHSIYVYRDQPPPSLPLAKCQTLMFADVGCAWNQPEDMEMAFLGKYGGGTFKLILKRGGAGGANERVTIGTMVIPGPYKNLVARVPEPAPVYGPAQQPSPYGPNPQPHQQYDPTASVAQAAMNHMANAPNEAIAIASSALASAANVIKNFQPAPASGVADDLQRALMTAMIAKITTPERDPIETYTRLMAVLRESSSGNGNGVTSSVIDKVLGAIVERGLNPVSNGPAVSMGAELVRILPNVGAYVSEAFANYARIVEAQRDAIALQKGSQPGYIVQPPPQPNPMRPPAALPTPATNGTPMENPVQSLIEDKIIEIYREPQSAEAAAEEALDFLTRLDRSIVPQLTANGEKGLMSLFETRPKLKPALSNPSRLQEFVRAFLHFAGQDATVEAKPN